MSFNNPNESLSSTFEPPASEGTGFDTSLNRRKLLQVGGAVVLAKLSSLFLPPSVGAAGDGYKSTPASIKPPGDSPPARHAGKFIGNDIRGWTGEILVDAPYAASNGRIAIIVYGEGRNALAAAQHAGKLFAEKVGVDVSYLHAVRAGDKEGDPNSTRIGIYANGAKRFVIEADPTRQPNAIAAEIIGDMKQIYDSDFAPKIVKASLDQGPGGTN
ncbi:MAG: hypothetical protein DHS20C02_02550 [Micavibrio sp.]|nr:MAG: hypothetical protein DHS20C02_02550 [Micavibrio sp.]